MEQLRSREVREAEVYKRELMAWFEEQKKEQERSRVLEEHTAKERFKVLADMIRNQCFRQYSTERATT